jgi:hypothetical protein
MHGQCIRSVESLLVKKTRHAPMAVEGTTESEIDQARQTKFMQQHIDNRNR